MYKRIISIFLIVCLWLNAVPVNVTASGIEDKIETVNKQENELNISAATAVSTRTVGDIIAQSKFTQIQGHGFAAEQGNNFIDKIKGKNTSVVGDNNIKNGPDRKIINRDGTIVLIQDKYYRTAADTIAACFDETGFRYIDADGNPMQIEVPKDQYDDAVLKMAEKIKEGKVKGVTDPVEAKEIVRKGNLTYKQAKNLAKAGTVESLIYDATHGVITAGGAFGISTVLNYAVCRMNGQDKETALKTSAIEGVKTGTGVFCTAVIAGQLCKNQKIMNVFKPSTEALTKALGEKFSKTLLKAFGQEVIAEQGESVAMSATRQAAQLLRSEVLVAVVSTVVFSVPDAVDVFRGRISKKQFVKNFAVTAVGVVAGMAGYGVGGFLGNLVVPGVGTVPGGVIGSILLGAGGGIAADLIGDYIVEDDADEMYAIVENEFAQLCEDYLVNEQEAKNIVDEFAGMLNEDMYKDMYQSEDRELYINTKLEPLFEKEAAKREKIEALSEEEMRWALKEELKGVVYVH